MKAVLAMLERRPYLLWILLSAVFAVASIPYAHKASSNASAFVRWQQQVLQLGDGMDIYQRHNYPNPPLMALLLYPFMLLPPVAGALCWYYLKVGMALLALSWTFRMVEGSAAGGTPFPVGAKLLVALLCLRPILGDLSHGNVNLFILFLVVGALLAFQRGREVWCGGLLALAIACKVTPTLFVPYFLWKRAWKTLAGCAVGLVLFVVLVPSVCLGWSRQLHLLDSWTEQMVRPYVTRGQVLYTEHNNQSLPAVVLRLTTVSPSFSAWIGETHVPVRYHNLLELSEQQAHWLVRGCALLFASVVLMTCRAPLSHRGGWRWSAEFAVIALGMLLFSERTWKHHCVLLAVPFAVLLYGVATVPLDGARRRGVIGCLSAAVVLMAATSTGLLPDAWAKLAQVYGGYVWANVLLLTALVLLLTPVSPIASRPVCERETILS